jgi:hypothetical protein
VKATREELALQVDEAEWEWLHPHLERGGVIVVGKGLDIAEVGERIAQDDTAVVGGWIESGRLAKPSAEQIAAWDGDDTVRFATLIISPYILVQEK